jgi:hypothetical protein
MRISSSSTAAQDPAPAASSSSPQSAGRSSGKPPLLDGRPATLGAAGPLAALEGDHPRTCAAPSCAPQSGRREFSAGWVHLPPRQQQALEIAAVGIQDPQWRTEAIQGLRRQFQHQEPDQRTTLLAATIRSSNSLTRYRSISKLAAGLRHLEPPQRKRLLDVARALTNPFDRAHSIAALGQGLEHLKSSQQDKLLQAAANPNGNFKTLAIKGLAAGLTFLPSDRQDTVVAWVLESDPGDLQANEIGALGFSLRHLQEEMEARGVRMAAAIENAKSPERGLARRIQQALIKAAAALTGTAPGAPPA